MKKILSELSIQSIIKKCLTLDMISSINKKYLLLLVVAILSIVIGALSVLRPFWFIIVVLMGLFLLLSIWKFELLFLFIIFIYPLIPQYIGFDFQGRIIINPHRALIAGLFLVWILRKAFTGDKIFHKTPLNLAIIFFLSTRLISVIFSIDFSISLFRFISEVVTFFIFYYVVIDTIHTKRQFYRTLNILIYSGILVSILGIIEFLSKTNIYAYFDPVRESYILTASKILSRTGFLRIEGGFGHPIVLGMYLVLLIPLVLNQALIDNFPKKILWILALLFMSLAVLFTYSRSAWVGLFLVLFFFSIRYVKKSIPVIPVIVISVIVVLVFNPLFIRTNLSKLNVIFQESVSLEENSEIAISTSLRLFQMKHALPIALKKPFTGFGIAKSKEATGLRSIDNYYLNLMIESGITSLIAILFLYLLIFVKLKKAIRTSKDYRFRTMAFSFIVSILSYIIILTMVSLTTGFLMFWVVIALAMRLVMNETGILYFEGNPPSF